MSECNCEFCAKCSCCGHRADEHMAGDGPCYMKDCNCGSFDNAWSQNEPAKLDSEKFAESYVPTVDQATINSH
jgi:hypothetical protein